jgi:glycosyltransferase involved in cell wall biosynthesis
VAGPILFLHPSDEAYGADRILLELVEAAMAEGRRVAVLLADDLPPGWLSRSLGERGVTVERVALAPARRRYLRLTALLRYGLALLRARSIVRRRAVAMGATIVHANTAALLAAALVGRPGGARLVWHVHEIVGRSPVEWILFRLMPVLAASRVIAVSGAVARHLAPRSLARRRVVVVHNGLPDRPPSTAGREAGSEPSGSPAPGPSVDGPPAPVIAYVGRLNRWKGYDVFVTAAGILAANGVQARFVIAGDAPPGEEWRRDDLAARVRGAGVTDITRILGQRDDADTVIEQADIVVVPSTLPDPLPTVVLEAMRAGRAVVASAHGGIPEMVVDRATGWLVQPGDPAALAVALRTLVTDPELRAELGRAGRQRFLERFSRDRFRTAIGSVWRSLE